MMSNNKKGSAPPEPLPARKIRPIRQSMLFKIILVTTFTVLYLRSVSKRIHPSIQQNHFYDSAQPDNERKVEIIYEQQQRRQQHVLEFFDWVFPLGRRKENRLQLQQQEYKDDVLGPRSTFPANNDNHNDLRITERSTTPRTPTKPTTPKALPPRPDTATTSVAPWRNSIKIPLWMKHYFQWHQDVRANISTTTGSWRQYQFLVVRCLHVNNPCGGTADRLRGLPFVLLLAHRTNRLLFYHWQCPCALEHLFVPPVDGLDWTWPPFPSHDLEKVLHEQVPVVTFRNNENTHLDILKNHSYQQVVSVVEQVIGRDSYNSARANSTTELSFQNVFPDVWHSVFVPSHPVQQRINQEMQRLKLSDDQDSSYHALHIRSRYTSAPSNETIYEHAVNSVNCLQEILLAKQSREQQERPLNTSVVKGLLTNGTTVFVAADDLNSKQAVAAIVQQLGVSHFVTTGAFNSLSNESAIVNEVPVHLDKGNDFLSGKPEEWNTFKPEEYYDIIVDLYLLSKAECLVTGKGFFGKLAQWLSKDNQNCYYNYMDSKRKCLWMDHAAVVQHNRTQQQPPKVPEKKADNELERTTTNTAKSHHGGDLRIMANATAQATQTIKPPMRHIKTPQQHNRATTTPIAPWRNSTKVPSWMKRYFQWHQDARANISKTGSWRQYQYLVVRCLHVDKSCGGTADRLRGLPFVLLLAHRTNRLLFYHWERPCALEDLFVPPVDGLDWTWPPISRPKLQELLHEQDPVITFFNKEDTQWDILKKHSNEQVVSVVEQVIGRDSYNSARANSKTELSFLKVYPDVWHSVFVPSHPVQQRINQEMQRLKLSDNNHQDSSYHALHIRSRYETAPTNETIYDHAVNSVNCLQEILLAKQSRERQASSNTTVVKGLLTNGSTIFVASDDVKSKQAVAAIVQQHGISHFVTTGAFFNALRNESTAVGKDAVPVHLDKGNDFLSENTSEWNTFKPEEYYDIIVDLYLLAKAECLVTGVGFYGRLAQWISKDNRDCNHNYKESKRRCIWRDQVSHRHNK